MQYYVGMEFCLKNDGSELPYLQVRIIRENERSSCVDMTILPARMIVGSKEYEVVSAFYNLDRVVRDVFNNGKPISSLFYKFFVEDIKIHYDIAINYRY